LDALARGIKGIEALNAGIGRAAAWLTAAMVAVQVAGVVLRYVFGLNWLVLQEGVIYLHGFGFMLAAAYTLVHDGHVRLDIVYRGASAGYRAAVDLAGSLLLLLPACGLVLAQSIPYVHRSWVSMEGSTSLSGIQAVYLLKTAIPVFAVLLGLQGLALAARGVLVLRGRTPPDKPAA